MEFKNLEQRELYKITADRIGVSEELVKYVVSHMFSQARASITNPQKSKIVINTFGAFSPKVKKLREIIEDFEQNKGESEKKTNKMKEMRRILSLTIKEEQQNKNNEDDKQL